MGTSLTGLTPSTTYDALIKVGDNGPLSATAKVLSDGLGNDSPLAMSTSAVGIGTATPVSKLQVSDSNGVVGTFTSSNFFGSIDLENTGGTVPAKWNVQSVSGAQVGGTAGASFGIYSYGASAYRLFINSSGNVGINTTTPNQPLTIGATNGYPVIDFENSNTAYGDIGFQVDKMVLSAYSSTPLTLWTNSNERLRITATGNVGIGTSSPNRIAEIVASSGAVLGIANSSSGSEIQYGRIAMYSTAGSNAFIDFGGEIRSYSGAGVDSSDLRFYTSNTAPSTEKLRILSGGGITFNGDTSQANALDDYEEGTWTIGISFGGGNTGITYDASTLATYTKIGRQVTVNGFVALTNKGSSTGSARITGLPFTIANSSAYYSAAAMRLQSINFVGQFQAYGTINSTTVLLQQTTTLGINTDITNTEFSNSSQIMISFTYFV